MQSTATVVTMSEAAVVARNGPWSSRTTAGYVRVVNKFLRHVKELCPPDNHPLFYLFDEQGRILCLNYLEIALHSCGYETPCSWHREHNKNCHTQILQDYCENATRQDDRSTKLRYESLRNIFCALAGGPKESAGGFAMLSCDGLTRMKCPRCVV